MMKLLLLSLVISVVTPDASIRKYKEAVYSFLGPGYAYEYILKNSTAHSTEGNAIECLWEALDRDIEFIGYNKASQKCVNYSPGNTLTIKKVQNKNQFVYYRHPSSEWIKTYALTMKAGLSFCHSFQNVGNPSDWKVDKSNKSFCPNFFRHPILDIWNELPIQRVKLEIYKSRATVRTLLFNGHGSVINDWFTKTRLMKSPFCSSHRDLQIWKQDGNCDTNGGWLLISSNFFCSWEKKDNYPQLFYSGKKSFTLWTDAEEGDALAIFISLKKS
ncbi:uncharacterized protein LOC115226398 [Argonauta hians]